MADGNPYSGPSVGSFEDDQMQGHKHNMTKNGMYIWNSVGSGGSYQPGVGTTWDLELIGDTNIPKTDGSNGTPRTGDETKPFAAGVLYIIKT